MESRDVGFKKLIYSQLCSVFLFMLGVAGGIVIGIYAFYGGPSGLELKCVVENSGSSFAQERTTTLPATRKTSETSANDSTTVSPTNSCNKCDKRNPTIAHGKISIFDPLTEKEMTETFDVLIKKKVIISREPPHNISTNYVQFMFLHPPIKQDALDYLDRKGLNPGRFAQVHVVRGGNANPDCMVYKVGPLGKDAAFLTKMVADGEVHINARPKDYFETYAVTMFLGNDLSILNPIFEDSFDGASYPRDLFVYVGNSPSGLTPEERKTRFALHFKGLGDVEYQDFFHALPVSGMVYMPTLDPTDWNTTDFYYLNQGPYNSSTELLKAYLSDPHFRKVKLSKGYRTTVYDRIFPKRQRSPNDRKFSNLAGPRSYQPSGPRYFIEGSKVRWMGWEFYLSETQLKGPNLFDIKFKGERMAYELALNEIALIYAADSQAENSVTFLDSTYGLLAGSVILGLDCPSYATILNMTVWNSRRAKPQILPIVCVFEADGQEAYWRHLGDTFAAGLSLQYLVVRVPITLGNYDYTIDFQFFYDGRITTNARATGYIKGSFWDSQAPHAGEDKYNSPYGYRVSDYHIGLIHDHTFGFKVDLDVLEPNNTFKLVHWKAGDVVDALNTQSSVNQTPSYYLFNQTRYVEWETLTHERGLKLSYNDQALWTVVSGRRNKWGAERAYHISPLTTSAQAFDDSFLPIDTFSFTKYHCAVTKRKDDEQYLTSHYDINRMTDPKGHLDKMLNKEPIANEDLVTWISVGFSHVPTSEDVPITTNIETGFMLKPHNFFDTTASSDMPQFTETKDKEFIEREPDYEPCFEDKQDTTAQFLSNASP